MPTTSAALPEYLGAAELRRYQLYLLHEKKLALGTVENCISALRALYLAQACFPLPDSAAIGSFYNHLDSTSH
jgi:hypothetical protein